MKRLVIIVVAIALASISCGSLTNPRAAGSPTVSQTPTPSALPLLSLSGKNSFQSDPITIPVGDYQVAWTVHDPEGSFYLLIGFIHGTDAAPQNARTWLINAEVLATSTGAAAFKSVGGQFIAVVETRPNTYLPTTWTLTVTPSPTSA